MFYLIEVSTNWCGENDEIVIETKREYSEVEEFAWEFAEENGSSFDHSEENGRRRRIRARVLRYNKRIKNDS